MAYNHSNLVSLGNKYTPNTPTSRTWNYTSTDNMATVSYVYSDPIYLTESYTYFDDADFMKTVRAGDYLQITASDGKGLFYVDVVQTGTILIRKFAIIDTFIEP